MPQEVFEVIVGVETGISSNEVKVAEATRYLAYADQTDTFGYSSSTLEINVYDDAVGIEFAAMIENDDALKRFMDEMVRLSRVETVERVKQKV